MTATLLPAQGSTRRMDMHVRPLGIMTPSKSQASEMAKDLDAHVEEFAPTDSTMPACSRSVPPTHWC